MDESLKSLLLGLATDPQELTDYLKDRESYLAVAGLSPEAREALLAGDQERVAELVGGGRGHHTDMHVQESMKKKKKRRRPSTKKVVKKSTKKK